MSDKKKNVLAVFGGNKWGHKGWFHSACWDFHNMGFKTVLREIRDRESLGGKKICKYCGRGLGERSLVLEKSFHDNSFSGLGDCVVRVFREGGGVGKPVYVHAGCVDRPERFKLHQVVLEGKEPKRTVCGICHRLLVKSDKALDKLLERGYGSNQK